MRFSKLGRSRSSRSDLNMTGTLPCHFPRILWLTGKRDFHRFRKLRRTRLHALLEIGPLPVKPVRSEYDWDSPVPFPTDTVAHRQKRFPSLPKIASDAPACASRNWAAPGQAGQI